MHADYSPKELQRRLRLFPHPEDAGHEKMASALVANFVNEILEVELMSFCLFVFAWDPLPRCLLEGPQHS